MVCDRYMGSTVAYQAASMGAGADWEWLCTIQRHSVIEPDAVVLLDVDPELSMSRVGARGEERSRFEKLAFQKEVRKAYLRLADEFGYVIIDASADADTVYGRTVAALREKGICCRETRYIAPRAEGCTGRRSWWGSQGASPPWIRSISSGNLSVTGPR